MIANKHTEVRLMSNLNDLLEDSKKRQDLNKKIHKHTFEYIMFYVSDNDIEDKSIYDKIEELATHYQTHCFKLAKEIKDEILQENGEELEIIRDGFESYDRNSYRCQKVDKEIFLNPKMFTQDFKDNLEEDLVNLIADSFFKELDNVVKVFEYKKKIDKLRKKESKDIVEDRIDDINFLIKSRINKAFEFYLTKAEGNAKLVIDNFDMVRDVIEDVFNDVMLAINSAIDKNIKKKDIETLFDKQMKAFIKEQRGILKAKVSEEKETPTVQVGITIPPSIRAYAISSIWKDITK